MTFVAKVVAQKGKLSAEELLDEVAIRLANMNSYHLMPRDAAKVIASVLKDAQDGRAQLKPAKTEAPADE